MPRLPLSVLDNKFCDGCQQPISLWEQYFVEEGETFCRDCEAARKRGDEDEEGDAGDEELTDG